jgi:hypothetical protein
MGVLYDCLIVYATIVSRVSHVREKFSEVKNLTKKIVVSRRLRIDVLERKEWHTDCSRIGGVWRIEPRRTADAVGSVSRTGSRSLVMDSRRSGGTEKGNHGMRKLLLASCGSCPECERVRSSSDDPDAHGHNQ